MQTVTHEWFRKAMYAIQHRYMSLKVDVSWTKLIYVIFEFVLLRITIIYLTKHRYIHVRNFVRKKKTHTLVVRSYYYYYYFKSLCERSACETRYPDIVTAAIYCYITTLRETWLCPEGGGVMLQRFEFTKVCMGKTLKCILAEIWIFFQSKWLTSMPCCLFYCPLTFQRDPKPFKRVIVFRVSSPKKE